MSAFDITMYVLAGLGVVLVVLVILAIIAAIFIKDDTAPNYPVPGRDINYERLMELKQELRHDFSRSSGEDTPTLKGRVAAIEQYLGIEVYVKPAKTPRVATRVRKHKEG